MDRGVWIGAVIGFLVPVVMFAPLNKSAAWFSAWQKPLKPATAATPAPAPLAAADQRNARGERTLHVRHQLTVVRRHANKPAAEKIAQLPVLDPKEQLARTIDPAKRPDWYLIDPTLKRGDVLFLQDKVVIFKGRKIGDLADYVPVSRTKMLSRTERRRIEKLAARPAPSVAEAPVARPNRVATAAAFSLRDAN